MQYPFFLLLAGFFSSSLYGQNFLIREPDSAGNFEFQNLCKGKVTVTSGSYDVLKGQPVKFMTKWGRSKDGKFFWTNGENIYQFHFNSQKSEVISSNWHFIVEFYVCDSVAYIVYNPSRQEGEHDNRYSPGLRFCCLNLNNGHRTNYQFPNNINFTNLSISPDRMWAVFVNTIFTTDENVKKYQLVLYDLKAGSVQIIDSGITSKDQWFGNDDKYNSCFWPSNTVLIYYKHMRKGDNGSILSYNILSKKIEPAINSIPERDFTWFGYFHHAFFFSNRTSI